ncbi:amidohydrolase, partial [Xanthomonas sp. Kuri4-1]
MRHLLLASLGALLLCGPAAAASRFVEDPYPSTYRPLAAGPVLIEHATVLTGTGQRLDDADVLLRPCQEGSA